MSDLWRKAVAAADDAALLFGNERYDGASSRAYYAMFNAARALLEELHGFQPERTKRHATVLRLFSQHFVRTGTFRPDLARFLTEASEARHIADYSKDGVPSTEVRDILDAMQEFMATARSVLDSHKPVP